jgi:hypothetical protein
MELHVPNSMRIAARDGDRAERTVRMDRVTLPRTYLRRWPDPVEAARLTARAVGSVSWTESWIRLAGVTIFPAAPCGRQGLPVLVSLATPKQALQTLRPLQALGRIVVATREPVRTSWSLREIDLAGIGVVAVGRDGARVVLEPTGEMSRQSEAAPDWLENTRQALLQFARN